MLMVNEIFGPTIQGEGKTAGKKVKFLRLAMCNLSCVWCDKPYTWNWKQFEPAKEKKEMIVLEVIEKIISLDEKVQSLVISGGEPLLQQSELKELLYELEALNYWVEIETNGTILPNKEISSSVDQINCSVKLSNSGNSAKNRIRPDVLFKLARHHKTNFKFVISTEEDVKEVLHLVECYKMKNVYLMPLGQTKQEQLANQHRVKELCKQFGFLFSPRLHVLKWDTKRGV